MKRAISFFLMICLLLSAFVLAPAAEEGGAAPATPEIIGTQLHIGRSLTVKIYIRVPEGTMGAGVYASLGKGASVRLSGTLQEDGSYLVCYEGMDTTEMAVNLSLSPWALVGTDLLRGEEYIFSVRDYATRLLRHGDLDDTTNAMLVALLNYGTAVQEYLDIYPYHKPNDYLTEAETTLPTLTFSEETKGGYYIDESDPDRYQSAVDCIGIGIEQRGYFRFYFHINALGQESLRINGGAGIPGCEDMTPAAEAEALVAGYTLEIGTVDADGRPDFSNAKTCTIKKVENQPGYYAASPTLSYLAMREECAVRVIDPDGKESATYFYSVAAFAKNILEGDAIALSPKEERLIRTLLIFGDALSAYEKSLAE